VNVTFVLGAEEMPLANSRREIRGCVIVTRVWRRRHKLFLEGEVRNAGMEQMPIPYSRLQIH
jgi:hypothetical protein